MTNEHASRAGLWARALALTIDLVLVGLLIGGVGLLLTAATGGKVRLGTPIIDTVTCVAAEDVPAVVAPPQDFKTASVRRCTHSALGIEHDWTLVLAEQAGSEPSSTRQIVVPLDRAGRSADPFYIDGLTPLVLVLYLFLFEWRFGATPGKRALGIRVQAAGGTPLDISAAGKRSLMRTVPFLALVASAIYLGVHADPLTIAAFAPPPDVKFDIDLWPWDKARTLDLRGLDDVIWIAFALNYIVTTVRGTLPWHDRWAGTEAVWR